MKLPLTCIASGMLAAAAMLQPSTIMAYQIPSDVSQQQKPATVKVLLMENAPSLILEAKGKYQICHPHNHYVLSRGSTPLRARIIHESAGMKWKDPIPGAFHIRVVPASSETTFLVNGIQYRGCVEIIDNHGKYTVINEVDAESFLRSTLAYQFREEMNKEVLNALVIVERTNLYHTLSKKTPQSSYHFSAGEVGYRGHGATIVNSQLEESISETRHAIMTLDGNAFAAEWNENSAGKTASFALIHRKNTPSPQGVELPISDSDRLKSGWSFTVTKQQLAQIASLHQIAKIALFSEKHSGKVYAVKMQDSNKQSELDFFTLQKALGENRLKSNDFTIAVENDNITFKGYGKGSGTGLCLHSATSMAEQGLSATRILDTFFPSTKLEKLKNVPTQLKASKT